MANEPATEPTFEDALGQLERIVDDLERGEPELSTALAKYEAGVRLLGRCQSELERAERSVALLTGVDAAGQPVTAPFDASATVPRPVAAPRKTRKRSATTPGIPETDASASAGGTFDDIDTSPPF